MTQISNRYSENPYGFGSPRIPKEMINIKAGPGEHATRIAVWLSWNTFLRCKNPAHLQMVHYHLFCMIEFYGEKYLDLFSEKLWIYKLEDELQDGTS